jgi:hypothetical protein
VFLRFFRSVSGLRDPQAARSFIVGICIRVVRGERRKRWLRRWLTLTDGGSLPDTSCIAPLGDQGCGFEGQLKSVRQALDSSNAANAGFLRADAHLAVILVTNEDDCSARRGRRSGRLRLQ